MMSNIEPQKLPIDIWLLDRKCLQCKAMEIVKSDYNYEHQCKNLATCLNAMMLRDRGDDNDNQISEDKEDDDDGGRKEK